VRVIAVAFLFLTAAPFAVLARSHAPPSVLLPEPLAAGESLEAGRACKETGPLTEHCFPLLLKRERTGWRFADGADAGPAYRAVRRYEHVIGFRYWLAEQGKETFLLQPGPAGWRQWRVVSYGLRRDGTPLVLAKPGVSAGAYVFWADYVDGPFQDAHIARRTDGEPIVLVDGQTWEPFWD